LELYTPNKERGSKEEKRRGYVPTPHCKRGRTKDAKDGRGLSLFWGDPIMVGGGAGGKIKTGHGYTVNQWGGGEKKLGQPGN